MLLVLLVLPDADSQQVTGSAMVLRPSTGPLHEHRGLLYDHAGLLYDHAGLPYDNAGLPHPQ